MNLVYLECKELVVLILDKYFSQNELDYLRKGKSFFILSEKYPYDIAKNINNYFKLFNIDLRHKLFVISNLLSGDYTKERFKELKRSLQDFKSENR